MVSALVVTPLDVAKTRLQMSHGSRSMLGMMRHIVRAEGISHLWTGTSVAMVHAIPTVGVYLLIYDTTFQTLQVLWPRFLFRALALWLVIHDSHSLLCLAIE